MRETDGGWEACRDLHPEIKGLLLAQNYRNRDRHLGRRSDSIGLRAGRVFEANGGDLGEIVASRRFTSCFMHADPGDSGSSGSVTHVGCQDPRPSTSDNHHLRHPWQAHIGRSTLLFPSSFTLLRRYTRTGRECVFTPPGCLGGISGPQEQTYPAFIPERSTGLHRKLGCVTAEPRDSSGACSR